MIDIGRAAPSFECLADDGTVLKSSDLLGSAWVLYFYPQDDTEACTLEARQFSELARDFASLGMRVIGVSPDSLASHCRFRDKYRLGITLLSDADRTVCEAFGVWAEKSMFGRTYMGVVRSTYLIDDRGRVLKVWTRVKTPGHAAAVLAQARAWAAEQAVHRSTQTT
jgi:peroxiredoxin Q/BCP